MEEAAARIAAVKKNDSTSSVLHKATFIAIRPCEKVFPQEVYEKILARCKHGEKYT
jgi:hypothetical protein